MARPTKQGIDYFPFDVGFFEDIKVRRLKKDCGNQAISILIAIFCSIYRDEGYYLEINSDLPFLIAEQLGISEDAVTKTVEKAVQVGIFDSHIFHTYQILTSRGIQERYFTASKQKKIAKVRREILIKGVSINDNTVFIDDNLINLDDNPQSKGKGKGKVKEDISTEVPSERMDYKRIQDEYHKHCSRMPKIQELNDKRKATLKAWGDIDQMIEVFKKAGESDFLNGSTGWNSCGFDWIIKPGNRVKILEGNYDNGRKGGTNGSAGKYNLKTEKIG